MFLLERSALDAEISLQRAEQRPTICADGLVACLNERHLVGEMRFEPQHDLEQQQGMSLRICRSLWASAYGFGAHGSTPRTSSPAHPREVPIEGVDNLRLAAMAAAVPTATLAATCRQLPALRSLLAPHPHAVDRLQRALRAGQSAKAVHA